MLPSKTLHTHCRAPPVRLGCRFTLAPPWCRSEAWRAPLLRASRSRRQRLPRRGSPAPRRATVFPRFLQPVARRLHLGPRSLCRGGPSPTGLAQTHPDPPALAPSCLRVYAGGQLGAECQPAMRQQIKLDALDRRLRVLQPVLYPHSAQARAAGVAAAGTTYRRYHPRVSLAGTGTLASTIAHPASTAPAPNPRPATGNTFARISSLNHFCSLPVCRRCSSAPGRKSPEAVPDISYNHEVSST